jgi:hypothetical protein
VPVDCSKQSAGARFVAPRVAAPSSPKVCGTSRDILALVGLEGVEETKMARHIIMDPSGHSTFQFDKNSASSLAEAERRYNDLMAKGYVPAKLGAARTTSRTRNSVHSIRMRMRRSLFLHLEVVDAWAA